MWQGVRSAATAAARCALLVLAAGPASGEGWVYLNGDLGIAAARGSSGGSDGVSGVDNTGADEDSSPRYGGALGLAWPIDRIVPWDFGLPSWSTRVEMEVISGRSFEFATEGALPYSASVESWSIMSNLWLDVPVHGGVAALFGRIPVLEPLSLYAGFGLGVGKADLAVTNTFQSGSDSASNFAWQFGAGIGYEFTERVTFTLGYRRYDMGSVETRIAAGSGSPGNYTLDLDGNEISSGLRITFYNLPTFWD